MAVFFSLAVLLALPLLRTETDSARLQLRFLAMGACLGMAVLAKGLVPLVLAVPLAWFLRRWWRVWCWASAGVIGGRGSLVRGDVSAAWHAVLREFFFKHHFERFYSERLTTCAALVLLCAGAPGGVVSLDPLAALVCWKRAVAWDQRRSLLAAPCLRLDLF